MSVIAPIFCKTLLPEVAFLSMLESYHISVFLNANILFMLLYCLPCKNKG